MTSRRSDPDPVLVRLAALPAETPTPELSAKIRTLSLARLRPRPLPVAWTLLVAASVIGYLAGALSFTVALF
jgi:hypothetical protein